jgi:hypothetical protein
LKEIGHGTRPRRKRDEFSRVMVVVKKAEMLEALWRLPNLSELRFEGFFLNCNEIAL